MTDLPQALPDALSGFTWNGLFLPIGALLVLIIVVRRGFCSPAQFELSPRRMLPFSAWSLVPIGFCWLVGWAAAAGFALILPESDMSMMIGQIAAYVPVTAYIVGVFFTHGSGEPLLGRIPSHLALFCDGVSQLGLIPRCPRRFLREGALGILVAVPVVWGLNQASITLSSLGGFAPQAGHQLMAIPGSIGPVGMLLCVLLLAPLFEELVFRGLVQSCFRNIGPRWFCVAAAASIFALIHLTVVPWRVLPGILALGLILGWLYEHTGSLWPGILTHGGFNLANVALVFATDQFETVG